MPENEIISLIPEPNKIHLKMADSTGVLDFTLFYSKEDLLKKIEEAFEEKTKLLKLNGINNSTVLIRNIHECRAVIVMDFIEQKDQSQIARAMVVDPRMLGPRR